MTPHLELITAAEIKGADVVPSPSLDQVREYIRKSKAENTLRGMSVIGAHSARGASCNR
jgi:hypothetical protein